MNNAAFGKTMENVRKHKNIKIRKKKELFRVRTKLPYGRVFHGKFISNRNETNSNIMNEPVYLDLSILDLRKTVLYEFWYDYVKLKYNENGKLWIQTVSLLR